MTSEIKPPLAESVADEMALIALAHLSMIAQAANGEYKPRPGEIETRQAWLIEFFKTGQGLVTESDRQAARLINAALSTQSGSLSTQPIEATA